MRKIFLSVVAMLALFISLELPAAKPKEVIQCKVYRIVDGDGFHCRPLKGKKVTRGDKNIRMIYIDAPEMGQHYGQNSRQYLTNLISNRVVKLKIYGKDRYNRNLAEVFYHGKNINQEMVRKGYAFRYYHNPHNQFVYKRLEEQAKRARLGVFANPNYIRPNDWRRYHHNFKRPKNYK